MGIDAHPERAGAQVKTDPVLRTGKQSYQCAEIGIDLQVDIHIRPHTDQRPERPAKGNDQLPETFIVYGNDPVYGADLTQELLVGFRRYKYDFGVRVLMPQRRKHGRTLDDTAQPL